MFVRRILVAACTFLGCAVTLGAQEISAARVTPNLAGNIDRPLRYRPDHGDFVIENGAEFFNRPLYGGNTAFRVDGGDKPEFVLYLPGRGGNLRLGLRSEKAEQRIGAAEGGRAPKADAARAANDEQAVGAAGRGRAPGQKWLHEAASIETRYRPGELVYEIRDPLLGPDGVLRVAAVAYADTEGLGVRIEAQKVAAGTELVWAYGGANGQRGKRDGDIGTESVPISQWFQLRPEFCRGNQFELTPTGFTLHAKPATIVGVMPAGAKLAVGDAAQWNDLGRLLNSAKERGLKPTLPVVIGSVALANGTPLYLSLQRVAATAERGGRIGQARRPEPVEGGTPPTEDLDVYREVTAPRAAKVGPDLRAGRSEKEDGAETKNGSPGRFALPEAYTPAELPARFAEAERHFAALRGRVAVDTPNAFLDAAVGALNVAADAVWDAPQQAIMHGAIAWRTRLLGWRGPYALDALGWHERFRKNAEYWFGRQTTDPISTTIPPPDEKANLARNEKGLHTNGDISNSHYDMNLVFIDAVFRHLQWTGDLAFAKEAWPVIQRHLAWERRLFRREYGPEKLPLYEAYAAIWASDDLQYSGGGAMHATAYNYYENRQAARLARMLGADPAPYEHEADLLARSMRELLWVTGEGDGVVAAVHDRGGPRSRSAATAAADHSLTLVATKKAADRSADRTATAESMAPDHSLTLVATKPGAFGWFAEYKDWLGEQRVHPDAALWTFYHTVDSEVPTPQEAWQMTEAVDAMIPHIPVRGPGVPPGLYTLATSDWMPYDWSINNVVMAEAVHAALAFWEAGRPDEAWAVTKGSVLAAMFMGISPGNVGSMSYLDVYRRESQRDFADGAGVLSRALVEGLFGVKPDALAGEIRVVPGWPAAWDHARIQHPDFSLAFRRDGETDRYEVAEQISGGSPARAGFPRPLALRLRVAARTDEVAGVTVNGSPAQWAVVDESVGRPRIEIRAPAAARYEVAIRWAGGAIREPAVVASGRFERVSQGAMRWWVPVARGSNPGTAGYGDPALHQNGYGLPTVGSAKVGDPALQPAGAALPDHSLTLVATKPATDAVTSGLDYAAINLADARFEPVELAPAFNDRVTQIFRNEYRSPRSPFVSLALPKQGIGGWAGGVNRTASIDDAGLRAAAAQHDGRILLPNGVPFATPSSAAARNVVFTSEWDNYPRQVTVSLAGRARGVYLLMAGSTDPMQSRFENGEVVVTYADGTTTRLPLVNPTNWWPIEQDYFLDDFQFRRPGALPMRIDLKTGRVRELRMPDFKGHGGTVPGGAATVLALPLDPSKSLQSLQIRATAIDVVIGLLAATLVH